MSNDDACVKIEALVGSGSGATISADLEGAVPEGRSILLKRLEIDPGCSDYFKVLRVNFRRSKSKEVRDVLEASSHVLAGASEAGTTSVSLELLELLFVERHQSVQISVMNVTDLPHTFSARLVGKICSSPNLEEPSAKSSVNEASENESEDDLDDLGDFLRVLVDKCRGWFDGGLAAAILSARRGELEKLRRNEIVPELEPQRPPRIRDLLGGLVADVIAFARIPFYIAQEGCLKMMEKMEEGLRGGGSRRGGRR
jgi:hypothetical protein